MNILSLFDGISCGRLALERAGIQVDKYFASEIDKYAIQIAKKNYPDTIHIGSVTGVEYRKKGGPHPEGMLHLDNNILLWDTEEYGRCYDNVDIDMIIGGSPCQDLSIAKKDGKGLQGEKSSLFFEYVRLLKEVKPKYFLLENVASMKKVDKEEITRMLGVEPVMINSALVSAQNRKRLYWFGKLNQHGVYETMQVEQPKDKCILLKDILEPPAQVDERMIVNGKSYSLTASYNGAVEWNSVAKKQRTMVKVGQFNSGGQGDRVYSPEGKSVSLSANGGGRGAKTGLYEVPPVIRKLTPIECERLQTLTEMKKRIECNLGKDLLKSFVDVEQKNLKLQNVVGSAGKNNTQETVKYAEKNTNLRYQKTNEPALLNVRIDLEGRRLQLQTQNDIVLSAKYAEQQNESRHQKKIESIVPLSVQLFENLEKIVGSGNEELQKSTKLSIIQENGNYVVEIYGQNINENASDVVVNLTETRKQIIKSTISKAIENINPTDTVETILYFFVKNVIDLCIQNGIPIENLSQINFEFVEGYTFGVSNTQRYKAIGNGWTVDVIAHIFSYIGK